MSEHRFQGKLEESHGDYGGVCNLLLVDGHFVLEYVVYAPHHIEDGELFRSTYTAAGEEIRMEAVEHTSYHEETERQEKTRSGKWQLTLHAVKEGDPGPLSGGAGPFELVPVISYKAQDSRFKLQPLVPCPLSLVPCPLSLVPCDLYLATCTL